ncbi:16S rRNA (guanine(966)-N(2))-methyltransferase RsmD [Caminibacter pacificus]|jgi:16S rRNA (guanine(966)-N(2))-methyltransferase RsmD|uniref:16S rRNA (Guanine(966)-N(2))-methyltransferase RsmD n=1 Tax=Caminibacter pacificus TaxID=1424653 RepID=A0AAJ4UY18_9BACT|nr:16S rRNA (guanine(966)-N(2))-methyltransferase RsmD [Caminibacter pacificus]NPA88220.1 16S rRNA (guanine(966)-N(2))-methyltransferase RsmD [Campylobacterota bacterium]QCI27818.1 16S rRNA (guanine(966)-N(2))-methyltransferase RsmD [Caminibacter pacificus]ROR40007.1 16S rRNA (guanine(966)-N(2))-methyltransferase RsmD [Caminibacter pacificus]
MEKSNIKIIAGKYRGKKLYMNDKETTRSTKQILKESIFNSLQWEVPDSTWVEVFSGVGSIGLEAISRGAKKAYFLEKDPEAAKVLKRNIDSLKPEDSEKCEIILGDSFDTIWDVIEKLKREKDKAIFYFDPPFAIREGYEDIYDKVQNLIKQLPKMNVEKILIEHQSDYEFPEYLGKYKKTKTKKFGKSAVTFYE